MPTSNKTTKTDLSAILEGLLRADVKFILVGGLAAVIQGAPVTTLDVDIVHDQSSANIAKLFQFLQSLDAIYRRPDDQIIAPKEEDFSGMGHALFATRFGPLDVLSFIEQKKTYEDLLKQTVGIEFRGHTMHVLDIKTMIDLKKTSHEAKDKQRLTILEETLRQLEKE